MSPTTCRLMSPLDQSNPTVIVLQPLGVVRNLTCNDPTATAQVSVVSSAGFSAGPDRQTRGDSNIVDWHSIPFSLIPRSLIVKLSRPRDMTRLLEAYLAFSKLSDLVPLLLSCSATSSLESFKLLPPKQFNYHGSIGFLASFEISTFV